MTQTYDRHHVESVLRRVGLPPERRSEILAELDFPIELPALQAFLAPFGITHDALISHMGGSP